MYSDLNLDQLRKLARTDALTGKLNRIAVEEAFAELLSTEQPPPESLALAVADIDSLKPINDRFGHLYGDEILRFIANSLEAAYGDGSLIGCLGGDEFLILSQGVSREELTERAEIARRPSFGDLQGSMPDYPPALSLSIGIAWYPTNGSNFEELVVAADAAMNRAKQSGGNRVDWA